jgi:hypothetical protein
MALIEIEVGGKAPQRTVQLLQSAVRETTLAGIDGLPGATAHVAIVQSASTPATAVIEVNVSGHLPDQTQADLANSCWETTRMALRRITGHWSAAFNAPAQVRALANCNWDDDGQAHRWPDK